VRSFDIVALSPSGLTDPALAVAAARAGGIGLLDIGPDSTPSTAEADIQRMLRHAKNRVGVRIGEFPAGACDAIHALIPRDINYIVVSSQTARSNPELLARLRAPERQIWVEVNSVEEALDALDSGVATGLIAKGNESGGRVGEETTFVLLQRLLGSVDLPILAQGGIGTHTAAACYAAGAAGVVLDLQLALVRESVLPDAVKSAIQAMDGGETTCMPRADGSQYRFYSRGRRSAAISYEAASVDWTASAQEAAWPIGQDAVFAGDFARRFKTAGGVITAIRDNIRTHVTRSAATQTIAEQSPLAVSHGTQYPIVQGAMTRVSDRAEFAKTVADGGALPLLALALMRKADVEPLLDETSRMLAGQPWGVGVLGFVPPELRDEQLEIVRKFKPPFALIAGGRPDQAQELEKDGIATYLHVPSPGLLKMFLQEGARRFVFEGRECGGHVGPRSSFVLWNTMVDVLLAAPRAQLDECHVLFAGGVHDAMSAAMVGALPHRWLSEA
jgi:NAD(P)H-dependent flavin oxidoreductase YrpB (nitropropane dioxygenase family)